MQSENLPTMPQPDWQHAMESLCAFSAQQMRDYARDAFLAGLAKGASDGFDAGYAITNERWNAEHYPDDPKYDLDFSYQREAVVEVMVMEARNAK